MFLKMTSANHSNFLKTVSKVSWLIQLYERVPRIKNSLEEIWLEEDGNKKMLFCLNMERDCLMFAQTWKCDVEKWIKDKGEKNLKVFTKT